MLDTPKRTDDDSAQGWLVDKCNFMIDQDAKTFYRYRDGYERVVIPFDEIAGHTRATFKNKAMARGWISAEEAKR